MMMMMMMHAYEDSIQEIVTILISFCCKFIGVNMWQNLSK